jgi:signal transduction histidine kinase
VEESTGPEAEERLHTLLRASQWIVGDLALEVVLRRIVEAACELLQARYGALGVLDPEGQGLERFIHVGIDEPLAREIGDLPSGKGVLGALIEDPRPIRLEAIADDPRSVGFPAHHPPMGSFLGVPVLVREEVFGNLYLTERRSGSFTEEDVELARSLAATAGVAIENARLFEEARRRQEWLQASAGTTVLILSSDAEQALDVVAGTIHRLAEADVVTVVLPTADGQRLSVPVAVGLEAESLMGSSYELEGTLTEQVLRTREPVMVSGPDDSEGRSIFLRRFVPAGPVMILPLSGRDGARGTLVVARLAGRPRFRPSDLETATTFANHAAVALELADARRAAQRMAIFEERDRIARDLHDHVIQQIFAAGMSLQCIGLGFGDGPEAQGVDAVVDSLDAAIKQIRASIYQLRDHLGPQGLGIRAAVLEVVSEVAAGLETEAGPDVRFSGPVDTVVDAALAADVLAVVREALTNVSRHADAHEVLVGLTATSTLLELRVADDGRGVGTATRRSGLGNLRERAERRGGTCVVEELRPGVGTVVRWQVPVDLG